MSEAPTAAAPPSDPSPDAPEACGGGEGTRSQQRLRMLRELAEIGMRLARGVERRAEEPETAPGDAGLVFSRIARAVRQTLALEARLEEELEGRVRKARHDQDWERRQLAHAPIAERSRLVRRAVGRAIEADAEDEDQEERLFESLDERLGDREDDDGYLDRPIGELVALICKDLGVAVNLGLWEDEDWAIAEAAARAQPPSGAPPQAGAACDATPLTRHAPAGAPSWLSG
jgi:ribosome-binding protein aMBF1 (putative translation factor)